MIKEYCMRFYTTISLDIFQEWLKILISICSIQELQKKDIEKMSEIYFQTHIDLKAIFPVKLSFTLFSEFLIHHSFMDNFFVPRIEIRPRNLSIEMEMEDDELVDLERTVSPSLMKSFNNFEIYSKFYQRGYTPNHFWIQTGAGSPHHSYQISCLSPTTFAN
jgi:hypothetical protein